MAEGGKGYNIDPVVFHLLPYLQETGLLENFRHYNREYGKLDPIIFEDGVYYLTEHREGYIVRKKLQEIAESTKVRPIIEDWKKYVNLCILYVEGKIEKK